MGDLTGGPVWETWLGAQIGGPDWGPRLGDLTGGPDWEIWLGALIGRPDWRPCLGDLTGGPDWETWLAAQIGKPDWGPWLGDLTEGPYWVDWLGILRSPYCCHIYIWYSLSLKLLLLWCDFNKWEYILNVYVTQTYRKWKEHTLFINICLRYRQEK